MGGLPFRLGACEQIHRNGSGTVEFHIGMDMGRLAELEFGVTSAQSRRKAIIVQSSCGRAGAQ